MKPTRRANWIEYRRLPDLVEVDFHYNQYGRREISYDEAMDQVYERALRALKDAQAEGKKFVLFTHGWSTSRPGQTTARSQVRKLVRSKQATPYIIRADCIQDESVFVCAIRQKEGSSREHR